MTTPVQKCVSRFAMHECSVFDHIANKRRVSDPKNTSCIQTESRNPSGTEPETANETFIRFPKNEIAAVGFPLSNCLFTL